MQPSPRRTPTGWRVALVAALLVSGCAGLPRIDPSGRRFLIWPEPAATSSPALPSLPQMGNVDVPPAYPGVTPPVATPPTGPPYGSLAGGPAPAPVVNTVLSPADEELKITPSRLLAPVGSEVILKAGVCNKDGYLRTNRRIEWMLGQEGSGQFVTVGERGEMDFMRLPWERPNKVDNAYAVGYTAPFYTCLRRGTADESDDVQVQPGEAWITVTSASEGVSYVTATAPGSKNWDARRSTATVYWVDAQWRLPAPMNLQPGQTGTLTTTVTRQTDGAPVAGWLVRYEVLRGDTARLGYESGQASEVATDASGRASMQISPTDDQPGTAVVKVTVVRPATSTPMPSPRLEVGGGETVVTWSPSASVPVGPPVYDDGGQTGGVTPPSPFEPPPRGDDGDTLGPPVAGIGPRIELVLEQVSPGPVRVGEPIPVTVTLLNTGDAPAENLVMAVEYDRGLSSPQDRQGLYRLERSDLPALGPGDSTVVDIDFTAVTPGQQCYGVTVSADSMASAFDRKCITVEQPVAPARPRLRIESALDAVREVGQKLGYIVTVHNDGQAAAEGLNIEVVTDQMLKPLAASDGTNGWTLAPKGFRWQGEAIPAGGSARFEVEFECVAPSSQAKVTAYALQGDEELALRTDAVEILPARPVETAPPTARADLEGVLSSTANPAKVGQGAVLNVAITNTTNQALQNVQYRLRFEQQIRPSAVAGATVVGSALEFVPLTTLAAGDTYRFSVPYSPVQQGVSRVWLDMRVGATGAPVTEQASISISPR